MNIKEAVTGGIITLVIGGAAYTINQTDVINNFSQDTGLSQEQAEEYINNIDDEDFIEFYDLGQEYINEGKSTLDYISELDCATYMYDWESATLTCEQGKNQLQVYAQDNIALGEAYQRLDSDSGAKDDLSDAISVIDKLRKTYNLEIIRFIYDTETIDEFIKNEAYNKAILTTTLEQM